MLNRPKKVGQEPPNKEEWGRIQEKDGKKTNHDRLIWSEVWSREKKKIWNVFYWFGIKSVVWRQVGGVTNGEINLRFCVAKVSFFRVIVQKFVQQMQLKFPRKERNTGIFSATDGEIQDRDISGGWLGQVGGCKRSQKWQSWKFNGKEEVMICGKQRWDETEVAKWKKNQRS